VKSDDVRDEILFMMLRKVEFVMQQYGGERELPGSLNDRLSRGTSIHLASDLDADTWSQTDVRRTMLPQHKAFYFPISIVCILMRKYFVDKGNRCRNFEGFTRFQPL
jgi:hypothetical protein